MDLSRVRLLTIGGIIALTIAVIVVVLRSDRPRDLVLQVEPVTGNDSITVYAGGAVATPGLYTLPRGSRVASLLDQSGLANGADLSQVQMAAQLRDGQELIVPTQITGAQSQADVVTSTPQFSASLPININSASVAELESLSGVGPSIAQRIIDYRNANGPFSTVDELSNVQGISSRMVDDFRDQVTVGP